MGSILKIYNTNDLLSWNISIIIDVVVAAVIVPHSTNYSTWMWTILQFIYSNKILYILAISSTFCFKWKLKNLNFNGENNNKQ